MRVRNVVCMLGLCSLGACGASTEAEPRQDEVDTRAQDARTEHVEQHSDAGLLDAAPSSQVDAARAVDVPPPPVERPPTSLCAGHSRPTPITAAGLKPAAPADYLAIRVVSQVESTANGNEEWLHTNFETISETGSACAKATSGDCADKVSRHPQATYRSSCAQVCVEFSVVTTRGDEIKRWSKPDELLALLGPIDSIDDALMLVMSKGYDVYCPRFLVPRYPAEASADAKPVEGGFEVIATQTTKLCPVVLRRFTLFVSKEGEIVEKDWIDLPSGLCA
jgi:hypothetical protein